MLKILLEGSSRMTLMNSEEFLSRSGKDKVSSFIATLRPDVDDSISIGDDVKIMFDDDDTISLLDKRIEDIEELLDIREVESCCRFIEDVEGLPCRTFGEIKGELDTLCFTTR